jgi:hypothetical protein
MYHSSTPCILHASPIWSSFIWSPYWDRAAAGQQSIWQSQLNLHVYFPTGLLPSTCRNLRAPS